jgi:tight adherence protein C
MSTAMFLFLIIGGIVLIGAGILVFVGLRSPHDDDPLQMRLADYANRGEMASLEEIELSQPFTERIIYPLAERLGDLPSDLHHKMPSIRFLTSLRWLAIQAI